MIGGPDEPVESVVPVETVAAIETEFAEVTGELLERGIRRVHVVAWRDLDDPDAGGSEVHADEFMRRWAAAGIDIVHRTSEALGRPPRERRNGYQVDRAGNRYTVFPISALDEVRGSLGRSDAFVEIWNGVPWFAPVWYRRPHIVVVHHIHGPMWNQIFGPPLAAMGRALESRLAPPLYRKAPIVTPSEATRQELLELGFRPESVVAVNNGIDAKFTIGAAKTQAPSLLAVGRLAPVKRFGDLIEQAVVAKHECVDLTLTIVGDGPQRGELENLIAELGAENWITLTGRVDDEELVAAYQRAWLVVSASLAEGWGLSLTEGAACGTPSVATNISGHRSSVIDGISGELVPLEGLGRRIAEVVADPERLQRLRTGALQWASELSWDRAALGIAKVLLDDVRRRQGVSPERSPAKPPINPFDKR